MFISIRITCVHCEPSTWCRNISAISVSGFCVQVPAENARDTLGCKSFLDFVPKNLMMDGTNAVTVGQIVALPVQLAVIEVGF